MRTPRLATLVACALLGGALAVPAVAAPQAAPRTAMPSVVPGPAAAQKVDGELKKSYTVPTRHGPMYLEVVHPTAGGTQLKAHSILTISPYSVLGRNGDKSSWVPRGYNRMYADVIGTGNSGGCYDYGGKRERETAADVVEWVAKQPWSLGKVGMVGGSYDGTTATAAAIERPKGLATIVPQAAISRWYDYAYSDGVRYTYTNEMLGKRGAGAAPEEGFDTPVAFDFGLAVPPPLDVTGPGWAERVQKTMVVCDEIQHTEKGYDLTPEYDAFWVERDYARHAKKIEVPVLVSHNWGDWNVKQDTAYRLWEALPKGKQHRLYMGSRWNGHSTPAGEYKADLAAWMDRWVGGVRNGIEQRLPEVVSQTATAAGPGQFLRGAPRTSDVTLHLGGTELVPTAGAKGATGALPITGTSSETGGIAGRAAGSVLFTSKPLKQEVRLFGSPVVKLGLQTGRGWMTFAAGVVEVPATGDSRVAITRAWGDTRYVKGGVTAPVTEAKPVDYTFSKGSRIALLVQPESTEWFATKPYDGVPCPTCATYSLLTGKGGSSLTLPLVGVRSAKQLF